FDFHFLGVLSKGNEHVIPSPSRRGHGPHRSDQARQGQHLGDPAGGPVARRQVFDDPKTWFVRGATQDARLGEFDVILMRKDPPFDTEYIYTTYILDRAEGQGALVCNRPQGLRDMNEKVYTAWFPEGCAPPLITRDMHDLSEL